MLMSSEVKYQKGYNLLLNNSAERSLGLFLDKANVVKR